MNWQKIHKQVKWFWSWLWRKDAFIFLLFVGLAFIFWWGQAISSPRDMRMRVSVSYTDIPSSIALDGELPKTIEVTLRDEGKQLRQVRRQGLQLHINMQPYLQGEKGQLDITSEVLRPRLMDALPGSTRLQHIDPEGMIVGYTRQSSKRVAVKLQSHVSLAEQYQLVGAVTIHPDSVEVYGNHLDNIEYVLSDSICIDALRDTVRKEVPLIPPIGVRLSATSITAEWVAEQFTEKGFTLPILVRGLPRGVKMRLFPQVADVTIRVGVKHFANVDNDDLQLYCDYPDGEETDWLRLHVASSNPHVRNIRIKPHSVEYIIER